MACTGTPCARCWPTPCLRGTGDRLRQRGPTLRQAQEEPYTGVIDRILEDDLRRPRKQRHTTKRIFERLRDEYGFDGGYTTVKDYVREHRRQTREMFVPLSRTGAELLFEVFCQRYERGSILVTTNLPFDEWTEVFGSERLTGALLDRLTHHVHILEMNGDSYRLKRSRETAASQAPDSGEEE